MAKLYPHSTLEFEDWFSTEEACRAYLALHRWPEGFRCPQCGCNKYWPTQRGLFHCCSCRADISVTAGTIFHSSHLPLRIWFRAMWGITGQKSGMSAMGLQHVHGIGSYKTAWACLHKLRRAMVRPDRELLTGKMEVDEAIVGGVEAGGGRRHLGATKALVAVAAEIKGKGIGRIRLHRIPDASENSLLGFVQGALAPGSVIITDGWPAYFGLAGLGYIHHPRVISTSNQTATTLLPRVHRVAALLKRWLLGIHQGRVSRDHLDYYLDEFTFRFNRRRSRHRGKLFYRLVQQAVATGHVSYRKLIRTKRGHTSLSPTLG